MIRELDLRQYKQLESIFNSLPEAHEEMVDVTQQFANNFQIFLGPIMAWPYLDSFPTWDLYQHSLKRARATESIRGIAQDLHEITGIENKCERTERFTELGVPHPSVVADELQKTYRDLQINGRSLHVGFGTYQSVEGHEAKLIELVETAIPGVYLVVDNEIEQGVYVASKDLDASLKFLRTLFDANAQLLLKQARESS